MSCALRPFAQVFLPDAAPLKFGHDGNVLFLAFNMRDHFDVVLPKPALKQQQALQVISTNQPNDPTSNSATIHDAVHNKNYPSSVTLLSLNVNSWKVHKNELLHAADLLVLQETRLTSKEQLPNISQQKKEAVSGDCPVHQCFLNDQVAVWRAKPPELVSKVVLA